MLEGMRWKTLHTVNSLLFADEADADSKECLRRMVNEIGVVC